DPTSEGISTSGWRAYARAIMEKHPTKLMSPRSPFGKERQNTPNYDDTLVISVSLPSLGLRGTDSIALLRTTILPTTLGQEPESKILMVTFMVVGLSTAYNIILERPTLNRLRAVVSTYHRTLKFPTKAGVGEVRSDP
ncbi:hypothetical protein BHE74_00048699, partial [Ensete ventricosum]